jgi:hypothetical protein
MAGAQRRKHREAMLAACVTAIGIIIAATISVVGSHQSTSASKPTIIYAPIVLPPSPTTSTTPPLATTSPRQTDSLKPSPSNRLPEPAVVVGLSDCGTDWNGASAQRWNIGGQVKNPNASAIRTEVAAQIVFPDGHVGVSQALSVAIPAEATAPFSYGTPYNPDEPLPNDPYFTKPGGGCRALVESTTWQ